MISDTRDTSLLKHSRSNVALYLMYSILAASSAMFIFAVHTPRYALFSFCYFAAVFVPVGLCLFSKHAMGVRKILASRYLWLICILVFTAFDETRYVQRNLHHPEIVSAAPALIEPALALLHGNDPYAVRLLNGVKISPGPGWMILLAPITTWGGAGLMVGLSTLLVGWLIGERTLEGRGIFTLLVSLQIVLVQVGTWGSDLFAIPIVYAALCLLAVRWSGRAGAMIFLGVVAGLFAQSRMPMVSLLLILALGVWRRNRRDARLLMIPATVVCVSFYISFYLWTVHDHVFFQPLHLLHRERASGLAPTVIGPIAGVVVVAGILYRMRGSSEEWILAGGLLLFAAFAPTGLGELAGVLPHMELWEGANYVSFGISLLAAYLALTLGRDGSGASEQGPITV